MTAANELCDTNMRQLANSDICDTDETPEEQESFSFHDETDLDDIPPSLLSYFETSKSRAAVCEKLILEELEDCTASHHTEDTVNLPIELDKDMMKLNEQVICDTENEENNTSSDTRLLPAPTETEALFTHKVSVCPNNEDEAGTNKYTETKMHLAFDMRTLEISMDELERKKSNAYEAEQEKQQCEEMMKEEQKRQIERDFQEELRKIMEAEKLHQRELELMEKSAQEKLEQEFLLQQELINSLQRQVEEERRRMEKEQKRLKDEEDKRKREEEKNKIEAERKRMEEETRRKKEEEKKRRKEREEKRKREQEKQRIDLEKKKLEDEMRMIEEEKKNAKAEMMKKEQEEKEKRGEEKKKIEAERKQVEEEKGRKKEEERKIEEERKNKEEKRRMEREETRKREEERNKVVLEKKKLDDEMSMMEEEKKKADAERMKEQEENGKREEERKKIEARKEMEKRKMERGMSQKWPKKEEEERKKREEGNMRMEEERRVIKETEQKKKQEKRKKKEEEEEEEADDRKRMAQEKICEEIRKRHIREHGNVDEEIKPEERKKKEAMGRKMTVEEEKEETRKREKEKERKKMEEKKNVKEVIRKQEDDKRKMKEEFIEENEKSKREDELKTKEGEQRRKQKEKSRRQMEEENYEKTEMRLKEEKERCDEDYRKMEYESKTKDEENKLEEEEKKKREERENVEAEKELNGQEVGENKEELYEKTEDVRLIEKEESNKRMVKNTEARAGRTNELKRDHNSMMAQNEKNNTDKTGKSSQLEDSTTWTSSSPGPLPAESAVCPTSTGAKPQQHNPDKTSIDKTVDCRHQAARPSTVSLSLPAWLPEHAEQKRLSWMNDCIPWSKLSLQNRRKQKGSVRSRRGLRRAAEASGLQPLCSGALLQATGWKSLQEVTAVTLEDLPGCSLSTLAQCTQLRSLSLRRCGLKSLESISQLSQLCYIDVQENDISFVDCENMTSLRVLQLSHNKLTSIHGLAGAENLDVLDLSHNSITRIAGLESVRRLQRLSVEHNQLISTKGLRDVYTLLHLNCSHNHLASVEGLENSALLNTLDLRANSLTEPPGLNNQVLLRELLLDDNSISSLKGLTACWLPLMQHLSVAQNRITQLPSMSDSVSLENLDLRFNCISELQNVSESLQGCHFLREIHLTGNPLQQESGWRSTLQKAVPGLRAIDDQQTDCSLSPPAVQQVGLAPGSFLVFCQAQLQQTQDLQQQHSRELSNASSSVDAVEASCRHFAEALQLATDQRFAHEYGDTTVADKHRAAGQTIPEETLDVSGTNAEKCTKGPETGSTAKVLSVIPNRDAAQSFITHHNIRCSAWTFDEKSAAERHHGDTFTCPQTGPTVCKVNFGSVHSLASKSKTIPSNHKMAPVSTHQDLDLKNAAAVVIQQLWRKCRQKCGNISSPSTAEKVGGRAGDGGKPESGPAYINGSVVGQDCAATVIQAFWRGCTVRRRLASALAAVKCPDSEEDDTFEEVDVDEFVLDEAALDKQWTLPTSENSPPRCLPVSERLQSLKHPEPLPEPSQHILPPPLEWRSKQAWVAGEQVDSTGQKVSPVSCNRSKSPASASAASGLSERSERILEEWGFTHRNTALLMLKRAQKMRSKKQQKEHQDPSVHLALFRNCSYQLSPVEARKRQTQHNRNTLKVCEAKLGLQQAEKTERVKQERAQQWLHTQAAHFDRDSESVHFLPEISSDILNGGRVQLMVDPGYADRLHHASGLCANSSLAAQPCKENSYPRRNSLGHAREEVPSLKPVTSAPSKKERISFRDNLVQLSGGWGGGKKRNKYK
ncbi:leucine-rich repeat- and IQ domain-containing protein 1 [Chaetodon trifascialis]|uniref:leucine-rich repeat- and IQ domain-containing protein 1 n=1 Tax=Chaetodon trifascialis TaxID=109706 RepID=UPI00399401CC